MAIEKTYSMLKPDAVRTRHVGDIIARIDDIDGSSREIAWE